MNWFNTAGKMAIGSRLRLLTEKVTADAREIYLLYGVDFNPKWFPVFYSLSQSDMSITELARNISHSHVSVSKIVAEMIRAGVAVERKNPGDGRKNFVGLSKMGIQMSEKMQDQYGDVEKAIEQMVASAKHNLWTAIEEWEFLLNEKSLFRRVLEAKKSRETEKVRIVAYSRAYAKAFRALNEEWISTHFEMEDADHKSLKHPKRNIIDKGGAILVALYDGEPVGVCALIRMNDPSYDFELAKMAVSPRARGKNIGYLLGKAMLKKARSLGGRRIYLESNTILVPAINLYHKLGFEKVSGRPSPYKRCNIQMGLTIK